jgi:mannose/fructose/N-acetylgalactosamine-specific phosphotransferase system component IID
MKKLLNLLILTAMISLPAAAQEGEEMLNDSVKTAGSMLPYLFYAGAILFIVLGVWWYYKKKAQFTFLAILLVLTALLLGWYYPG